MNLQLRPPGLLTGKVFPVEQSGNISFFWTLKTPIVFLDCRKSSKNVLVAESHMFSQHATSLSWDSLCSCKDAQKNFCPAKSQ